MVTQLWGFSTQSRAREAQVQDQPGLVQMEVQQIDWLFLHQSAKYPLGAGAVAQQAEALAAKPKNPGSIPRIQWRKRLGPHILSSDLYMQHTLVQLPLP